MIHRNAAQKKKTDPKPPAFPKLPKKSGEFILIWPGHLQISPNEFQYKNCTGRDADAARGVNGRLRDIEEYKQELSNTSIIWVPEKPILGDIIPLNSKNPPQEILVVDGHQRHDLFFRCLDTYRLAGRIEEIYNIRQPAIIYFERDGYTIADMRLMGARKNIAEGSGSALDVAMIIREAGKLPPTISRKSRVVAAGEKISILGNEAFDMFYHGVMPEPVAEAVGATIKRFGPKDDEEREAVSTQLVKTLRPRLQPGQAKLDYNATCMILQDSLKTMGLHATTNLFGEEIDVDITGDTSKIFTSSIGFSNRCLFALYGLRNAHKVGIDISSSITKEEVGWHIYKCRITNFFLRSTFMYGDQAEIKENLGQQAFKLTALENALRSGEEDPVADQVLSFLAKKYEDNDFGRRLSELAFSLNKKREAKRIHQPTAGEMSHVINVATEEFGKTFYNNAMEVLEQDGSFIALAKQCGQTAPEKNDEFAFDLGTDTGQEGSQQDLRL